MQIALNADAKFVRKLKMENLVNFHQTTPKSQNWDFDGILLSKVENI